MTKLQIFNTKGEKSGTVDMPKNFEAKSGMELLSQAVYVYEGRSHKGSSLVKTRSNVTASGAKIYKQKGTGRARHGDVKAPIFVGGGIAHGPKGVKRKLQLSKRLKRQSVAIALSQKANAGKVFVVDKVNGITKTKEAASLLDKITKELKLKTPKVLFALSQVNKNVLRSFRNISNLKYNLFGNLNARDILSSSLLLIDKEALNEKLESNKEDKVQTSSVKISKSLAVSPKTNIKTTVKSKRSINQKK